MTSTTNTIGRLTQALVIAVALAAFTAPVAFGDDPSDRPGREAQTSQTETQDWFERAAARGPRAETPDWFERAAARHSDVPQLEPRALDNREAALLAHSPVIATGTGNAFDWGDFGFGVAASFGVLLLILLSAGILTVRGHRGGRIRST